MSDSLWSHGLQHTRLPCPSPSSGACSNSCTLSWWCRLTIWSLCCPLLLRLQFFPASGSFLMSWLLSGGQVLYFSFNEYSVLPRNIQGWFPLGLTGLISLQSEGLSKSLLQHRSSKSSILSSDILYGPISLVWLTKFPSFNTHHLFYIAWLTSSKYLLKAYNQP